jgi:uncharacterized membrane protein
MTEVSGESVNLVDHLKQLLFGLIRDSSDDALQNFFPLLTNLFVGGTAFIPSLAITAGGIEFARKMTSSGSEITLMTFATMIAPLMIGLFVSSVCYMGILNVFVKMARGLDVGLFDILTGFRKLWSLFAAVLLMSPLVILGLLFFILPGLYLLVRAALVPVIIIDENAGPITAIKRSFEVTADRNSDIVLLLVVTVIGTYFMSAVSLLAGSIFPALSPLLFVPFFLISQYIVARAHVTSSLSQSQIWSMVLDSLQQFNRA